MVREKISWGEEVWESKINTQGASGVISGSISSENIIKKRTVETMKILDYHFLKKLEKNSKVLDLGVGPMARFAIEFSKRNFNVTGVDISSTTLKFAKERIDKEKIKNIKLIKEDIIELKTINEKYDFVYLLDTFGHIPKYLALETFNQISRVLKKEGYCLIEFWYDSSREIKNISKQLIYQIGRKLKSMSKKTFSVIASQYTLDEIKDIAKRSNFKIEKIHGNYVLLKKMNL